MAKSRGRKFAELVAPTNGVFAAASIPTIALSKLASSTVTINSESLSLGGSLTLDTSDIGEHTSNKYFTDTRAQASLSVASNSGHGALAYDSSNGQFTFAGITTEAIQDVVGAMFSSNTETAVTVNYQDSDGTIDLVVDDTTKIPLAGGTMTGNLTLNDNVKAYFGSDTDLQIYHNGTNGFIINSTGELRFSGSDFAIKSDSAKLLLGADDDLQIFHDGNNSRITDNGTGSLILRGANSVEIESTSGEDMAVFRNNAQAELYYNNVKKFETASNGISVTGAISLTEAIYSLDGSGEFSISGDNSSNTYFLSQGEIRFRPSGTTTNKFIIGANGALTINGQYTLPTVDGTANQVLTTDGSGNVSFASVSGSGTITAVVAGTNLTGGATSGSATVNLAGSLTSMSKITFTNSNVQAPTTSDATTGARLVLYSNGSGRDYSIGIESDTMWFNSDADYKWYSDGSPRMLLDDNVLTFYTTAGSTRGYITATETDDAHFIIATSNNEDIAFKDNGVGGTTNFLIRGDGNLYQGGTNLIWHAGNDGTGSGLDADYLDGIQGSQLLRSDNNDSFTGNSLSFPTLHFSINNNNSAGSYNHYIRGNSTHIVFGTANGNTYYQNYGNTSGSYNLSGVVTHNSSLVGNKIWGVSNDGSGSGLDADTVDGIQAASFLRSDTNDSVGTDVYHDYGPNSTWSSTLRVGGNGYSANQNNAFASVVTTNGNLHLDAGGNRAIYLNHYSGTAGISFGGGASGSVAWMGPDGDLWKGTGGDNTGDKYWHAGNDGPNSGLYSEYNKTLVGQGGISNAVGTSNVEYSGQISASVTGLFNASNNANGILRLNTHSGNYYHDLGFSSDGNMYHRNFSNSNAFTTAAWYKVWDASNDGSGSGLDADSLDGVQGASYARSDASDTLSGDYAFTGGHGAINITSSSIVSNASSTWTGNPGTQGKIQYHSNRWYIVSDSSSNRIVQFRRDGGDVSYIANSGNFVGNVTGNADTATTATTANNAQLLDSLDSTDYARRGSSYATYFDGTASSANLARFYCNGNIATSSAYQTRLEVFSGAGVGTDAFMTFHVGSDYAAYFGMDGGINDLAYGGWSKGANSNRVWHAANDGSGSGLDADTVDGQHASAFLTSSNDRIFITDTRGANRLPSYYDDRYMQADFTQSTYLGVSGGDTWSAVLTVSPWTVYASTHRQQQLIFAGTNLYRRTASGDNAWGSTYNLWDSGNDGSGSGLDADTVDSIQGASLLRSDASDIFGSTSANQYLRFNCNSGQYIASGGSSSRFPIEVFAPTANGGDAGITFHVGGDYAGFFGLDSALNDLAWGGWSVGSTTKHRIWHQGNDGSGSGLDADLLDGLQGSSYMGYLGMATNRDDYVNLRVVRNSGSSAGSNGMYIGYGNAGGGVTRLYGGGSTSNYVSVSSNAITFSGINCNSFNLNNGAVIHVYGALGGPTSGQNAQNGGNYRFGYQYLGAWSHPYPDLVLGYHTGMRLGGHTSYGGTRIYSDHPHRTTTILFSVGNGDTHVRATNNIYAYTSDKRLKENFRPIENAVDKVKSINGLIFDWRKDMMEKHDFTPDQEKDDAGLIAQEVQKVMPAAIRRAPFDHDLTAPNQSKSGEEFLTVQYEKMVPLLVEAIKEQQKQIDELKKLLEEKE